MKSIEAMTDSELECEKRYVESRRDKNPIAEDYLNSIKQEIQRRHD